jgi:hypothetical protein
MFSDVIFCALPWFGNLCCWPFLDLPMILSGSWILDLAGELERMFAASGCDNHLVSYHS